MAITSKDYNKSNPLPLLSNAPLITKYTKIP